MVDETIQNLLNAIISEIHKKETEIFETALRTFAEPPIKGEITKGKLKWRGIVLIQHNEGLKTTKWLSQRGVQISPKIVNEPQTLNLNQNQ